MARTKTPDGVVFRSITTFQTKDETGAPRFIREGLRLRQPIGPEKFWIVDTGDDAEAAAATLALSEESQATDTAAPVEQAPRKVKAIKTFEDFLGYTVRESDLFNSNHPTVLRTPEGFEPIEA
jgi:hypothetical protein